MSAFDVFNGDGFTLTSLTAAINETEHLPSRIGDSGLFQESGVTTTTINIEKKGDKLVLVESSERGSPGILIKGNKRQLIPFNAIHLQQDAVIIADEIQNMRAFGSETVAEMMANYTNLRFAKMRRNLDATLEHHRIGAIRGKVLDADGSTVLVDLFQAFNLTKQTHDLALGTATTKVREKLVQAKRKITKKLGGVMVTGWKCYMSENFSDNFINHDNVTKLYERYNEGSVNRDDVREDFRLAGISFEEYQGQVNGVDFIPAGKAYLVPMGVDDMFITRFAPADHADTVNTMGLPLYADIDVKKKLVELEAQSNPVVLNTRPDCVLELS
jgi:hypothetical protein